MWIKRSLMIVPACLLVFLAQSFFWAPSNDSAADNEGRQNRIVFYMGGDPFNMNPWSSTTTTDSTLTQYLYEGLLRYNREYLIEPWLSEYAAIHHEIDAPVPRGMTTAEFETWVRAKYGKSVASFKEVEAGSEDVKFFDLDKGIEVNNQAGAERVVAFRKPARVHVVLKADIKNGQITSAVDPEFGNELYGVHMQLMFEPQGELAVDALTEALVEKVVKAAKLAPLDHKPVVEMRVRKGVYWTDGPFFSDPESTYSVSIDGDIVGNIVADSADAAISEVRERHDAKEAKVEAWLYDKRMGNEEEGPWWGRGPEMQAKDAKLTFDLIRDEDFGSPRLSSWMDVEEVRTPKDDAYKLEVVYRKLYSPALSNLVGDILPYHVWNDRAWFEEALRKERGPEDLGVKRADYNVKRFLPTAERDFRHKPPSHGPMVLEPLNGESRPLWKSAEIATLRRNEFYWERQPEYEFMDYLIFDPALGRETSEIAFLSGNMDIYTARAFQVDRYKAMDDKYYVLERETTTYSYLGFNCRKGPLANPRVRLALSMAVDIGEIMKYVLYDQGQRISGPAYPVLPWYNNDYRREHTWLKESKKGQTEKLEFLPYDMEEAEAILRDEGYVRDSSGTLAKDGEPFSIKLVNSSGGGERMDFSLLAKENWSKLGLKVEYVEYEWNVFIGQYVMPGNFDVIALGWSGGLNFDKRQLFHGDFQPPRGLNFAGYSNPKADELMEQILNVYNPDEQVRLSHEIFNVIADDCPYLFIYSPYSTSVMDRRIVWRKQVGTGPDGQPQYEDRPVNHEHISDAKQSLAFFVTELKRQDEVPTFTDEDRKR